MHHTMLHIDVVKNNQTLKGRDFCFDQIQQGQNCSQSAKTTEH